MKSYKDLEVYKLAYEYAIEVHEMSLELPKYELYEQGSQADDHPNVLKILYRRRIRAAKI